MARDDDENWKRRREREKEREQEEEEQSRKKKDYLDKPDSSISLEKFDDLVQRADPMIDQLNSLYNMFMSGAQKNPPVERRKQLDQVMLAIQMASKPTAGSLFKFNSINSKYLAHKERWDKMIRDLESGKIKRNIGPKRSF